MLKRCALSALVLIPFLLGAHLELSKTNADTIAAEIQPPQQVAQTVATTSQIVPPPKKTQPQLATPTKPVAAVSKPVVVNEPEPVAASEAPIAQKNPTLGTPEQYPVRLLIPSIHLDAPIEPVGVNSKGEMAVPSGSTNDVGWYKYGTMPGNVGSAVLDAHVFAALKNLYKVKIGDPVYVVTKGGTKLRFIVKESTFYTLSELTSDMLFGKKDARRLNLITCAGTFISALNTYDHRLVDYAIFDGEELQ